MSAPTAAAIQRLDTLPPYRRVGIRLTVGDFHKLMEDGSVPELEPWELLDGQILYKDRSAPGEDPMSVGTLHAVMSAKLSFLNEQLRPLGCHIRIGDPVTLPPYNQPQPDGAIVPGVPDDYIDGHPTVDDILCVIEISHSSLVRDSTTKMRGYAETGVPMYVILDVDARAARVCRDPVPATGEYADVQTPSPPTGVSASRYSESNGHHSRHDWPARGQCCRRRARTRCNGVDVQRLRPLEATRGRSRRMASPLTSHCSVRLWQRSGVRKRVGPVARDQLRCGPASGPGSTLLSRAVVRGRRRPSRWRAVGADER